MHAHFDCNGCFNLKLPTKFPRNSINVAISDLQVQSYNRRVPVPTAKAILAAKDTRPTSSKLICNRAVTLVLSRYPDRSVGK